MTLSLSTLRFLRAALRPLPAGAVGCLSRHASRLPQSRARNTTITACNSRNHLNQRRCASSEASKRPRALDALLQKQTNSYYDFFPESIPLGPPPSGPFLIDLSSLKREFLRLQALAHPDRLPSERRNAAQGLSAQINEAYKTLQSPLRRAEYLLEQRGARVQADEEQVLGEAEGDTEILMEVMEAREEAEAAESEEQINELRSENDKRIEDVTRRLEQAFANDDLLAAKREAVRLRYWIGVEDRLREGHGNH